MGLIGLIGLMSRIHCSHDFQFIDPDFDRLPGFDFGMFAGLDFMSVGFDRIPPHAFQLIRAVVPSGQNRVFAADLLVAFESQVDEKIFRAASDLDPVLVRGENRFPFVLARIGDGEERGARADDGSVGVFRIRRGRFFTRSAAGRDGEAAGFFFLAVT